MDLQRIVNGLWSVAVGAGAGARAGDVAIDEPDATAEIPVVGLVRRASESLCALFVGDEFSARVELPRAACIAGSQPAGSMRPTIARSNGRIEVDIADARRA